MRNEEIRKGKRRNQVICFLFVMAAIIAVIVIFFQDTERTLIRHITNDRADAVVTIGVYDGNKSEWQVYGEDGKPLEKALHTYAIGSVTKTFTGALIAKEEAAGKLNINDNIGNYLKGIPADLPISVKQLLTHTSGLGDEWEDALSGNPEAALGREQLVQILLSAECKGNSSEARYSNFGSALAGSIAAEVESEGEAYETVMNKFIQSELKLKNTRVGGTGDLSNYWEWKNHDEMMAAGAILSDVEDMLAYGKMNLEHTPSYLGHAHVPLGEFQEDYQIGYFWLIDRENDIIWHNGELGMNTEDGEEVGYQAFLGFSPSRNKVVVILSNVIANDEDGNAYTDLLGYSLLLE